MSTAIQKVTKTLVIKAGETAVLPKGATVISIGVRGSVIATSNCPAVQDELDNAEQYKCYSFGVGCDDDNNDTHVMDEHSAYIKKIIVGGDTYIFTEDNGIVVDWLDNVAYGISIVAKQIPKEILEVYDIFLYHPTKRKEFTIKVKMLPSIAETAMFYVEGTGFVNGLYLKPTLIDCPA